MISKRLRQSLGIKINTIPIRIDNSLVWGLVLADALVALTVLTALIASVVLTALTAIAVLVAHVALDAAVAVVVAAAKPVIVYFSMLRRSPALLQGSFSIR